MKLGTFSADEVEYLIATHRTHTTSQQAEHLNRPAGSVVTKRGRLMRDGLISPRDRKSARVWTPQEDALMAEMIQDGYPTVRIAKKLGRTHLAVKERLFRRKINADQIRAGTIATRYPGQVAALFGLSITVVETWLDAGELDYRSHDRRKHQSRHRLISDAQLMDFLGVRNAWPDWEPDKIVDRDWRDAALEARAKAGGRWLATADIAQRYTVALGTVQEWIRQERFPVYRRKRSIYTWSAALDGFVPPYDCYQNERRSEAVRRAWVVRRASQQREAA